MAECTYCEGHGEVPDWTGRQEPPIINCPACCGTGKYMPEDEPDFDNQPDFDPELADIEAGEHFARKGY